MATEPQRYLRKARESLASAEADVEAGRFNSAANRGYYACFQAAVAALLYSDIRPSGVSWQHAFVMSQFSGKLVTRRKLLPRRLVGYFESAFMLRLAADYQPDDVSAKATKRATRRAGEFVEEVEEAMDTRTLREARSEYEARSAAEREGAAGSEELAEARMSEVQELIRAKLPASEFDIVQLGPADYRLNVGIPSGDDWETVMDALNGRTIDILVEDGIWIVVIPHWEQDD